MLGFTRDTIERNGVPYLRRWLFRCPLFSIRLHHFVGEDPDHVHDHPWSFFSLLLKGGYTETIRREVEIPASNFDGLRQAVFEGNGGRSYGTGVGLAYDLDTGRCLMRFNENVVRREQMTWAYRHHSTRHRVKTDPAGCWTLVLGGPTMGREWGFWETDTERLSPEDYAAKHDWD